MEDLSSLTPSQVVDLLSDRLGAVQQAIQQCRAVSEHVVAFNRGGHTADGATQLPVLVLLQPGTATEMPSRIEVDLNDVPSEDVQRLSPFIDVLGYRATTLFFESWRDFMAMCFAANNRITECEMSQRGECAKS